MEIAFDGDDQPPIDQVAETITVEFGKKSELSGNGSRWSATGFVSEFEAESPLEDKMEGTLTVKMSGAITFTAES